MDETLSEKEQIEEMKAWWKENGSYVIAGLILGVGGIWGFNAWRSSQLDTQLEASALYELLVEEVADNRLEPAEELAGDIYSNYVETIYADEARLAMARLYMDKGRDQDAAIALQELLADGSHTEIQRVGRLRLAKILLYQGKPEDVVTLLDGQTESAFTARYNELIGDANFALGNYQEAEASYLAAMADPRSSELLDAALVQMKINDLPDNVTPDDSEAPGPVTDPAAEPENDDDIAVGDESESVDGEETDE